MENPVIIDQQYDALEPLKIKYNVLEGVSKGVKVSDVIFRNIRGTTNGKDAIDLNCARIGCTNIILEDIDIVDLDGKKASASCNSVQGSCSSCNPEVSCL